MRIDDDAMSRDVTVSRGTTTVHRDATSQLKNLRIAANFRAFHCLLDDLAHSFYVRFAAVTFGSAIRNSFFPLVLHPHCTFLRSKRQILIIIIATINITKSPCHTAKIR